MSPLIALEEHFVSKALLSSKFAAQMGLEQFPAEVTRKLNDLTKERIADMDASGVSFQIVSSNPGPGSLPLDICKSTNDQLSDAVKENSTKLAGFATIPMHDPPAAAQELSRCVTELGFVGALISNHDAGHFFDDPSYWPVFQTAQDLDVPIYIHPAFVTEDRMEFFRGNYAQSETIAMSAFAWGWHSEVGLHFLRLFASGLFDKFPRLKIVIGHDGEMVPFMVDRIDRFVNWEKKERSFRTVWDENVWVTTSGMFSLPPLELLLRTKSVDKVMFSVDYPFEKNEEGAEFMETIRKSGLLSEDDCNKVAWRNAATLLRLKL